MNRKLEKEIITKINVNYPDMNPVGNSSRGKSRHIRITKNGNLDKIIDIFGNNIKKEHNTKYSSSYYTLFIKYKDNYVPFIISHSDLKTNKKGDSIIQKSLSPSALKITGKFHNSKDLIENTKKSLLNKKINKELKNLLISLMEIANYTKKKLSNSEWDLYSNNFKGINKDFGEILVFINKLEDSDIDFIEIPDDSNNKFYDALFVYKDGSKEMANIKSEKGSGQSIKTIPHKYIQEAKNNNNFFSKGTIYESYIKFLDLIHQKKISGKEKHLKTFEIFSNNNDILSQILKLFKKDFFLNDFKKLKYQSMDFITYKEKVNSIFNQLNVKSIGIPIGTKNQPIEEYFKEKNSLNNILIFTLSTIVSHYHNQKSFDKMMKKMLVNNVVNILIKKDSKNTSFKISVEKNPNYKIHYWGNAKSPTNNILGYKTI